MEYIEIPVWVFNCSGFTFFVTIHFWTTSEDILGKLGQFGHRYFKGAFEDCKKFLH